ncbi:hypothetical protein SP19_63 [Salmonella phage 19]|nr:hypothetical protein SP19_63 [Salmonella phage 19]
MIQHFLTSTNGFEVYRGGSGELEIRWERDPLSDTYEY